MKPNCFYLRLDRSKFENGYYRVLMGLAENFLSSVILLTKQLNKLSYLCWSLYIDSKWELLTTFTNSAIARFFEAGFMANRIPRLIPTFCEEQSS